MNDLDRDVSAVAISEEHFTIFVLFLFLSVNPREHNAVNISDQ